MKRDEAAYAEVMAGVRTAAILLESAEPTLIALVKQVDNVEAVGFVTDPTFAHTVMNSRNIAQQVRIAKAVVAFMDEWRAVKAEVLSEEPDTWR